MAGESIVGALRAILGLDTAQFEDGAKRAASSANSLGKQLLAVFGGTTLSSAVERIFDFLIHSFKEAITHGFEFADQMGKMAQKVGIGVEQLTGLKLAADLSDVSMESLSTALGKLSKNMVAAAQGNKEMRDQFAAVGISSADLANKSFSVTDALAKMSDKFASTDNTATKTAAALNLMGRGGKDLIPLLNAGSDSIKNLAETAKNMGLVVTEATSAAAEKTNDNLKGMSKAMEGVGNLVTEQLAPGFARLTSYMFDNVKSGELIRTVADAIVTGFKYMIAGIINIIEDFKVLGQAFNIITDIGAAVIGGLTDLVLKAFDYIVQLVTKIVDAIKAPFVALADVVAPLITKTFEKVGAIIGYVADKMGLLGEKHTADVVSGLTAIGNALSNEKFTVAGQKSDELVAKLSQLGSVSVETAKIWVDKLFGPMGDHAKKASDQVQAATSNIQKELDRLSLQARITGNDFINLPKGLPELAVRLGLTAENGQKLAVSLQGLSPQLQDFATRLATIQANQIMLETQTPMQGYINAQKELKATWDALTPSMQSSLAVQEAFYLKGQLNAAKLAQQNAEAAKLVVGGWADAFKTLAEQNKQYAGAAKALAIVMATINTYEAATKAYASTLLPWPLNAIAAAGTVAAGLAMVAKISAQQFAQGGSFRVGGVGGIDSQLIHFRATPGEMVDIRKPGQQAGGTPVNVTIQGDTVSRDQVRSLFDTLNQGMRDGYRLSLMGVK